MNSKKTTVGNSYYYESTLALESNIGDTIEVKHNSFICTLQKIEQTSLFRLVSKYPMN